VAVVFAALDIGVFTGWHDLIFLLAKDGAVPNGDYSTMDK